jgi:DNA-binding response OmpR family regulator
VRVLVVEDDDGVRSMVGDFLRQQGHVVVAAAGAREAREALFAVPADEEEAQPAFDVALVDWSLPDLPGRQLVLLLAEVFPDCRVIVSTGLGEDAVSARMAGRRVAFVLRKPFSIRELSRALLTTDRKPTGT